jgi:hypothetical protein
MLFGSEQARILLHFEKMDFLLDLAITGEYSGIPRAE